MSIWVADGPPAKAEAAVVSSDTDRVEDKAESAVASCDRVEDGVEAAVASCDRVEGGVEAAVVPVSGATCQPQLRRSRSLPETPQATFRFS